MNAALRLPEHGSSLRALLRGVLDEVVLTTVPDLWVSGLSLDSRQVRPGSVFLAVPGRRGHGLDHAAQAVANGASMLLYEPQPGRAAPPLTAPCIAVPRLGAELGTIADRFYRQPSAALRIAAVTGTNGKSTTAWLIAAAAERCGLPTGYSGTLGYGLLSELRAATHTTPDVISLHRQLHELRAAGAVTAAIEVSSHALHQARIDAVRIDTAVFTNLSRDHLDYHGDMSAYGEAKALLFNVAGLRRRVINADDAFGQELLGRPGTATQTTAFTCEARQVAAPVLRAAVHLSAAGLRLAIDGSFGAADLRSPLLGRFNAENLLAALAVLLGWGVALNPAVQSLQQCSAPPGRIERVGNADKHVVIDYAHTPDALQKALQVLKAHCRGRVICVFGCGGDRDSGKRAPMGAVAAQLADEIILTNDNPRSEDPQAIVAAITAGMGGKTHVVELDRAAAITQALRMARPEDMVLIAGKGHEDYQIIGADTHHFSDREVVRAVLRGAT